MSSEPTLSDVLLKNMNLPNAAPPVRIILMTVFAAGKEVKRREPSC